MSLHSNVFQRTAPSTPIEDMPHINNKIRLEAFEALQHLHKTNRLARWRALSWDFINGCMSSATSGWVPTLHPIYIGSLTEKRDAFNITRLPPRIEKPILPAAIKRQNSSAADTPYCSNEQADRLPVFPWGPTCNSGGSLLQFGKQSKETLHRLPRPSLSDPGSSAGPATSSTYESLPDELEFRRNQSAIYDYFEDIKDPDYRFTCQVHQILAELASKVADTVLDDHKKLQSCTEALYQTLRARAYHLCNLEGRADERATLIRAQGGKLEINGQVRDVEDSCGMCFDKFDETRTTPMIECGHQYCGECILRWVLKKAECPLCQQSLHAQTVLPHVTGAEIDALLAEYLPEDVMMSAFGETAPAAAEQLQTGNMRPDVRIETLHANASQLSRAHPIVRDIARAYLSRLGIDQSVLGIDVPQAVQRQPSAPISHVHLLFDPSTGALEPCPQELLLSDLFMGPRPSRTAPNYWSDPHY